MVGLTLTDAQLAALQTLERIVDATFYLAGGVATAAYVHHRISHDIDLFSPSTDPTDFAEILLLEASVHVHSRAPRTLHLEIEGVPTSLLTYRYPLVAPPNRIEHIPVPVAASDDLIGMKLSAIAGRGATRDFWDLYELLQFTGYNLSRALKIFELKFKATDVGHVVRSLAYFGDAELEPRPMGLDETRWDEIRRYFEQGVRKL